MDTYRKMRNDKLAEAMIKKLAARNIEGYYVQTKEVYKQGDNEEVFSGE